MIDLDAEWEQVKAQLAPRVTREAFLDTMGRIQWHCPGRHGVLRYITSDEIPAVRIILHYYYAVYGNKGAWWKRDRAAQTWDVEFTHMAKVFPGPKKPWEWCGESVLFAAEHAAIRAQTQAREAVKRTLGLADRVAFSHQGQRVEGVIVVINRVKAQVLVGNTKWNVPYSLLTLVEPYEA